MKIYKEHSGFNYDLSKSCCFLLHSFAHSLAFHLRRCADVSLRFFSHVGFAFVTSFVVHLLNLFICCVVVFFYDFFSALFSLCRCWLTEFFLSLFFLAFYVFCFSLLICCVFHIIDYRVAAVPRTSNMPEQREMKKYFRNI